MSTRRAPGSPTAHAAFAGVFVVTGLGLLSVGATLPVLPRYVTGTARRRRARGRDRHRRLRDHRPRLPPARRQARRPPRAQAGRARRLALDRDRGPALFVPAGVPGPDRRPPLPRRRRGRRLHGRLGLGRRPGAARAPRPADRPLRARDLGRARARSADRRADPAGERASRWSGRSPPAAPLRRRAGRDPDPGALSARASGARLRAAADLARGAAARARPQRSRSSAMRRWPRSSSCTSTSAGSATAPRCSPRSPRASSRCGSSAAGCPDRFGSVPLRGRRRDRRGRRACSSIAAPRARRRGCSARSRWAPASRCSSRRSPCWSSTASRRSAAASRWAPSPPSSTSAWVSAARCRRRGGDRRLRGRVRARGGWRSPRSPSRSRSRDRPRHPGAASTDEARLRRASAGAAGRGFSRPSRLRPARVGARARAAAKPRAAAARPASQAAAALVLGHVGAAGGRAPRSAGRDPAGTAAASRTRSRVTSPRRCRPIPPTLVGARLAEQAEELLDLLRRVVDARASAARPAPRSGSRRGSARPTASIRLRGWGVCGSVARQAFSSRVGIERLASNSVRSTRSP